MIVLRKTMDAAIERENQRFDGLAMQFGQALHRSEALQRQLADWITQKGEALTPEQAATLFYSHDNKWQAAFFNALQGVVKAAHEAMPPKRPNEFRMGPGVPYGETQWCWMADDLDDSGFETIEAMYEHAKHVRDRAASAIEAQRAETENTGSVADESAAAESGDAQ